MEKEFETKAIRKDYGLEIMVRKMDKDEMPDDGVTYYCEEGGQIYKEDELDLTPHNMNKYITEQLDEFRKNFPDKASGIDNQVYMRMIKFLESSLLQALEQGRKEGRTEVLEKYNEVFTNLETK